MKRKTIRPLIAMAMAWMAASLQAQPTTGKPQQEAFKGPVKVFILAGQSNMEGHAGVQTLDRLGEHPKHGDLLKKIKKPDGTFVVRDDVFVSYKKEDEKITRPLSVGIGANGEGSFGPELVFGIEMGDHFKEPVLLIKTCWGGHSLYGNFRPPSAGKAAYDTGLQPEEIGASYRNMVKEVHECLENLGKDFPQLKGTTPELCGFVWFQGWNDMCADEEIQQKVFDEYCPNFVHLVEDLRAEFKHPNLPVVIGELGVNGDKADETMMKFRAAQAKIASSPELKGTVGYVRTAPFWYPELTTLGEGLETEDERLRSEAEERINRKMKGKPEIKDPDKMEALLNEAVEKAKKSDSAYKKIKKAADKHVCDWGCHYYGSARVIGMVGFSLAEAMKPLLGAKSKP